MNEIIDFKKEIEPHIIGSYSITGWFNVVLHSNNAPIEKDIVDIDGKKYEITSVFDDTDDEEAEQGLSYSKVYFTLLE